MAKTPTRSRKDRPSNVVPMVRSRQETPATEASSEPVAAGAPGTAFAPAERDRLIAERAYQLAEQRGFLPGGELEDWLAAEREIDARLGHRN